MERRHRPASVQTLEPYALRQCRQSALRRVRGFSMKRYGPCPIGFVQVSAAVEGQRKDRNAADAISDGGINGGTDLILIQKSLI